MAVVIVYFLKKIDVANADACKTCVTWYQGLLQILHCLPAVVQPR